ncbi:hypothetical protein HMPREF3156_01682 [Neisseria sp. HMSC06F02]|nr:hypothetical protein HMPREF3156_01682 [Neisseria sp. HMSC06F02]
MTAIQTKGRLKTVSDDLLSFIVRRPWDMSGRLKMYSGLTLNRYSVASPCRTICTVCGLRRLS